MVPLPVIVIFAPGVKIVSSPSTLMTLVPEMAIPVPAVYWVLSSPSSRPSGIAQASPFAIEVVG